LPLSQTAAFLLQIVTALQCLERDPKVSAEMQVAGDDMLALETKVPSCLDAELGVAPGELVGDRLLTSGLPLIRIQRFNGAEGAAVLLVELLPPRRRPTTFDSFTGASSAA
jgi:hypothetical protein